MRHSTHLVLTVGADCIDGILSKANPRKSRHGSRGLNDHNLGSGVNLRGKNGLTWRRMFYQRHETNVSR